MIDKKYIEKLIIKNASMNAHLVEGNVEIPSDSKMGDFAFPCFKLSKELKKAPNVIASELATKFKDKAINKVQAQSGYLNFFLDRDKFVESAVNTVSFDNLKFGAGKTICIDYSSINIAKPFHIGHLSSTVIGGSLYRMFTYLGFKVVGINHLGDWGTQFGKLLCAYEMWGDDDDLDKRGISSLLDLYVRFHAEAEKDKTLDERARVYFLKLEQGDKEALQLFDMFKQITLKEVQKTYDKLGVVFDSYNGESFYNDKIQPVVDELKQKNLLVQSDGAMVVEVGENRPPLLVLRSDGASLYATRDLATAIYRKKTYNFYKNLYVVAYQQNLHFSQVFSTLKLMGRDWVDDCVHVQFGMVSLKDGGSLSTRKGNVMYLSKVLDEAVQKALHTIEQKNPNLTEKETVAQSVGVGAIVFGALSNGRIKDIIFDIDKALEFEGETAPYLMYTHARCCSIIRKADQAGIKKLDIKNFKFKDVDSDTFELVKLIARFNDTVKLACEKYEPSILSRLLLDIAQNFNRFYLSNRIVGEQSDLANSRLRIINLTKNALNKGLELLLLKAPIEM
ncbi:MAG: arginine--tRNA ligase [Clostridiales bacterium]|jgi:arginyl-tRNA synthetase|nr:arginine--tRNA ligase [Clostridiales bacterium]